VRRLKESRYVEDEDQIVEATDLVAMELKKKKTAAESTLQKDAEVAILFRRPWRLQKRLKFLHPA